MTATRQKIEIPINKTRKSKKRKKISATYNKRVISNLLVTVFAARSLDKLLIAQTFKYFNQFFYGRPTLTPAAHEGANTAP